MLTVQHEAVTVTWKTRRKPCTKLRKLHNDPEKSHADSATRSRKSYKEDLEKSRNDSAARSHETYLKDPEKSHARNRESSITSSNTVDEGVI